MPTQTSYTAPDPEYKKLYDDFYKDVLSYVNRPFMQYGGNEIAPFSKDQLRAFRDARKFASGNVGSRDLQMARDAISGALTPVGQSEIDAYLNPYTQTVIDQTISDADRARQMVIKQNADAAARAGAFGGSRHGLVEAETNRNFADVIASATGKLRQDSFTNALSQANADRKRMLEGALSYGKLGEAQRNFGLQDIGLLSKIGGQQQALDQSNRTLDYQNWLDERFYPRQMLSVQQSALTGMPFGQTSTRNYPSQTNEWTQGLGGAGLGMGIAQSLFPTTPWAAGAGALLGGIGTLF